MRFGNWATRPREKRVTSSLNIINERTRGRVNLWLRYYRRPATEVGGIKFHQKKICLTIEGYYVKISAFIFIFTFTLSHIHRNCMPPPPPPPPTHTHTHTHTRPHSSNIHIMGDPCSLFVKLTKSNIILLSTILLLISRIFVTCKGRIVYSREFPDLTSIPGSN